MHRSSTLYDSPTLQILVRGTIDPRVGYEKALQIYDALHGLAVIDLLQEALGGKM